MIKVIDNIWHKFALSLVLISFCSHIVFGANNSFSVVTWNVLGVHAPDLESYRHSGSEFSFEEGDFSRFKVIAQKLNTYAADIVCLQEFAESFISSPKSVFGKGFDYVFVSHMKKGGSGVAICCKNKSDMTFIDAGTVPAAAPGACAWGLFNNSKDEKVLVASVHIGRANDRSGKDDGYAQWKAIITDLARIMKQHQLSSIVLAGDLNTFYEEVFNDTRKDVSQLLGISVEMYCHSSWTANGNRHFNFKDKNASLVGKGGLGDFDFASIDHVLYTNDSLKIGGNRSWVGVVGNAYKDPLVLSAAHKISYDDLSHKENVKLIHTLLPSDHLPVFVTFDFKPVQGVPVPGSGKKVQMPDAGTQRMYATQALELAVCL